MKNQNQKGFTLIEMLIVMGIITIISVIILAQYRTGEKQNLLRLTAQGVVNNLRRAQSMSLSAQEHNGQIPLLGGFGAHFDLSVPGSYILFADMDGDGQYNDNGIEIIEAIDFPAQVQFLGMSVSPIDIIFSAPDAVISITNGLGQATLQLNLKDTSMVKNITVKKPGVINY